MSKDSISKKIQGTISMKTKLIIKSSKIKSRVTWGFNPVTRIIKSKKIYSRKNYKIDY